MNNLLVCLLLIMINLSFSSPSLVGDVCTKTPFPKDCHDCFAGDSGTPQMTVRELAGTAIYCTYNLSEIVQKAFVDLANGTTDPNVKGVYDLCGSSFEHYVEKLSNAMTSWWNQDDDSAKEEFDGAKGDYDGCKKGLGKLPGNPLPLDLNSQFQGVNRLYGDSHDIILQSEEN